MISLHLIVVGKLKDKSLELIENDYLKRIHNPNLKIHEIKANAEDKNIECKLIEKKIKDLFGDQQPYLVALTESGKAFDSIKFSSFVEKALNTHSHIVFIISGAEGFSGDFLNKVSQKISLSWLTFPHRLARIILIEQLYRAQTIRLGHPYHN